jgi:hypothetical protein
MAQNHTEPQNPPDSRDIGDLNRVAAERRRADRALSMSERLARVHHLCQQVSAVKGAARARH